MESSAFCTFGGDENRHMAFQLTPCQDYNSCIAPALHGVSCRSGSSPICAGWETFEDVARKPSSHGRVVKDERRPLQLGQLPAFRISMDGFCEDVSYQIASYTSTANVVPDDLANINGDKDDMAVGHNVDLASGDKEDLAGAGKTEDLWRGYEEDLPPPYESLSRSAVFSAKPEKPSKITVRALEAPGKRGKSRKCPSSEGKKRRFLRRTLGLRK